MAKQLTNSPTEVITYNPNPVERVMSFEIAVSVDFVKQMRTFKHTHYDMTLLPYGIRTVSKSSGRVIILPWGNVKAAELFPTEEDK